MSKYYGGGIDYEVHVCSADEFTCKNSTTDCIPLSWMCDLNQDCFDGSDEAGCKNNCTDDKFRCKNGRCIPKHWKCDQERDCSDGSDEDVDVCQKITMII
uniref:Uncharacterized protein n=1 Tax=Phlebotomus papatasi TaxID=29031 RepID=A0A1B0D1Z7_PHLPP